MPAFDAAFDPPQIDPDDDEEGGNEPSTSSREVLEDLRAIGAISAEEARRHRAPVQPERQIRWEMRLREPDRAGAAARAAAERPGSEAPYDTEARFRKDIAYGRNREGPEIAGFGPAPRKASPPAAPRAERTPGVSFEERATTRPAPMPVYVPVPVPMRPTLPPPMYAPTPARVRGSSQGGVPAYPYGSTAPEAPSPAQASLEARAADEIARQREAARASFVRDFRSVNKGASESDAENAWEARLRASTMEL